MLKLKKFKYMTALFIFTTLLVLAGSLSTGVLASSGPLAPDLGSAANFVGLAASTFTNTGSGVFYGDVGVFPGTEVIGFPPGIILSGTIYRGGPVAEQAQLDALAAFNNLQSQLCDTDLTGQDLGGMTLAPGVYCFDTSAQLTGDLVLDAQDNPLAVWVFQTGSTLTTASASTVTMIKGGQALNVYWQVGSSATLGTGTRFLGNILADQSISSNTGASLIGRALALTGAVTMNTNGTPFISIIPLEIIYLPCVLR